MSEPIVEMNAITKVFPGVRALSDVSLTVRRGEIHALCGENGAGKSTLIKILGGVWPHGSYQGELRVDGRPVAFRSVRDSERARIAIIHQELALVPEMSVAENLFLGREPTRFRLIDRRRIVEEARRQLVRVGLDADPRTPVGTLGVGAQQLVEIAKALLRDAAILVLDEPTAALTESEAERLHTILRDLRERGVTMIYISHRIEEALALANRITVLRDGEVVGTWNAEKVTPDGIIEAMVGRRLDVLYPRRRQGPTERPIVLELREWTLRDATGRTRLDGVSFAAREGEILGIAGLMGAGRTELLTSLFGAWRGRIEGTCFLDGHPVRFRTPKDAIRAGIALVTEDRKRFGLLLESSVERNVTLAHLRAFTRRGIVRTSDARTAALEQVAALDIRPPDVDATVASLSGGNQQKVVLGKWLMTRPRILLLDEPTRGVDVGAKAEIHAHMDTLANEGVAILMVSSELSEILGMSDRVLVLHEGHVTGFFDDATAVSQEAILACATGRIADREAS